MTAPDIGSLIRQLHAARQEESAAKREADRIRKPLLELLESAGGSYVDEGTGLKAWIDKTPRYDYDVAAMHKLVEDGVLYEKDFADCLVTVVDKDKVKALLDKGILTDRQLARANAKVVTKLVETLKIEKMNAAKIV